MGNRYRMDSEQSTRWARADNVPTSLGPAALFYGEPDMAEVLADQAIQQVMSRDGVAVEQLNSLLNLVRSRLI